MEKHGVIWGMNGNYYDSIMNRCPSWVFTEEDFDDWFWAELGL